jgi:hypothetical protein
MERSAIDSDHLKIIEALRRISCGQNDNTIRSATGLSLETLSILRQQRIAANDAAQADLSRVSPFFSFNSSYLDEIRRDETTLMRANSNNDIMARLLKRRS